MPDIILPICKLNGYFFTIIHGLPFYLSTGANSGKRGTWFPCFGMNEVLEDEKSWIIKPSRSGMHHAMEKDETLYYVSPNVEIDSITWKEFAPNKKQSVLLLQWNNNILRARYLRNENQEKSFVFAKNFSVDILTFLSLHILFNKERLLSGHQLKQLVNHDFCQFKEPIYTFTNHLFTLFYQHVYRDARLAEISHFDPQNCRLKERFINLALFGISAQLHQNTPQKYMDIETMDFWASQRTRQLIASTISIPFPQLNMENYETFDNCNEVNQWLKANGGTVLPNYNPLDVFVILRATSFWILQQKKLGASPLTTISVLHSMGIQQETKKTRISLSIFNTKEKLMQSLTLMGIDKETPDHYEARDQKAAKHCKK